MFPMRYEDMKDLSPECYFGGNDVPPYYHLAVPTSVTVSELAFSIRSIGGGANCSGYIDEDGIHFHLPEDDVIQVDLSRPFVFVSQPTIPGGQIPSAWQVLFFLMEPVSRALFLGDRGAVSLEKTPSTMKLCLALDQLWGQEAFLTPLQEMVESYDVRERGLARLMKIHEEETVGASSLMWEFWDVFALHLMQHRLGLSVQVHTY